VCFVTILYLPTCAANLDFGSQAVEVDFFLQIISKQLSYAKEQMWPSIAIVFPSPEGRDSPVCDVDAGVHGHHL
jgi:hypothetical protein